MAASQVPWGVDALAGEVTAPAWKAKPSWYLVAADDRMIPPAGAAAMAPRAGATVVRGAPAATRSTSPGPSGRRGHPAGGRGAREERYARAVLRQPHQAAVAARRPEQRDAERRAEARAERQRELREAREAGDAEHLRRRVAVVLELGLAGGDERGDVRHRRHQQHAVAAEQRREMDAEAGAERRRLVVLRLGHLARPGEAVLHAGPERRREAIDQGTVAAPGLAALDEAEAPVHGVEAVEHRRDRCRRAEQRLDPPARPGLRLAHFRRQQVPDVGRREQPHSLRRQRRRIGTEQHVGDAS